MIFRRASLTAILVLATGASGAGLERFKDWNKSPEFTFLATAAEQKEWKKVKSDDEADHFVQLFWAKRDPDLKTPVNEFKVVFDERVKYADQNFGMARVRGALTERGKLYILLGEPTSMLREAGTKLQPFFATRSQEDVDSGTTPGMVRPANDPGTSIGESRVHFKYDADKLPAWSPVKSLTAHFIVEALRDYVADPGAGTVNSLEVKARTALLLNPGLKEPPHFKTAAEVEAEMKAAEAAAAEAAKGPSLSAPVRQALEEVLSKSDIGALTLFPITVREGETRLQVQLFAPGEVPGTEAKLAILVKSNAGADAARLEEVTAFDSARGGFVASRFFAVPPGEYSAAVAVLDASGKLVASAKRSVTVVAAGPDFSASPLVIASSVYAVPKGKSEEAFTLSGHHFITKGNRLDPEDGLAFVIRVYNPAVDPATKSVRLSRTVKLKAKGSPAMDVPQPADEPIPVPDSKGPSGVLTIDVAAVLIETNLGEYLRKPGDYDLKVSITDEVSKKTAEASTTFTVTGTLPPKKK
jgi:GWxTD domain-containing protein